MFEVYYNSETDTVDLMINTNLVKSFTLNEFLSGEKIAAGVSINVLKMKPVEDSLNDTI